MASKVSDAREAEEKAARQAKEQAFLRKSLAELDALPSDWIIKVAEDKRVYYKNPDGESFYGHPTLGPLPKPWIVRLCQEADGKRYPRYFNRETKRFTTKDPRVDKRFLRKQNEASKDSEFGRATSVTTMRRGLKLENLLREDIKSVDFRDQLHYVKVLDAGDGKLGAMNGGVFVVKWKTGSDRLMVEKRFKQPEAGASEGSANFTRACTKLEIDMLHRLRHTSISFYLAAFIAPNCAAVYVEFCDRGSMEDLIKEYGKHWLDSPSGAEKPEMPERFVWHAFGTLCDGLAFLQGGRSYLSDEVTDYEPAPGWLPILHRDMKPDNVLLRSRGTVGTKRYFYCVLSDFGLACEDWPSGHQKENAHQKYSSKLGTSTFHAPELLNDPYPRIDPAIKPITDNYDLRVFPNRQKHSAKSDLWALGACIYNLAHSRPSVYGGKYYCDSYAHLTDAKKPSNMEHKVWWEGTESRRRPLDISKLERRKPFSRQLKDAITICTRWHPEGESGDGVTGARPTPITMVKTFKLLMNQTEYTTHPPKGATDEELPAWATRVHDYHSRSPIEPRP